MNKNETVAALVFLTVGLAVRSALAVGLCEEELPPVTDTTVYEYYAEAYDLRSVFPVSKLEGEPALQGFTYSARGWRLDLPTDDPTRTATIIAVPGTFVNGVFKPGTDPAVTVLSATQGEGTFSWRPTVVLKRVYRLMHTVQVGGSDDADATCIGYLDFTDCADSRAAQAEVEAAALDRVTHKIAVGQDAQRPWQPIGTIGAGGGIATDAGLADGTVTTTAFSFKGRGTLHYEYKLGGGSLVVQADGESLESLTVAADWRVRTIGFDGFGAHDVAFVYTAAGGGATAALRNVRWEEEDGSARAQDESVRAVCDLRTVFPVMKLKDEPALEGFTYSARGWRIEVPVDDPTRTATIIAVPGTLVNGVFQPGAGETVTVLPATLGEGTVDWAPTSEEKCVYRLTHTALDDGKVDEPATCYGYLDLSQCADSKASQAQVEVAVLDRVTHRVIVGQDANNPWQPIQPDVVGIGIATDEELAAGTVTTTAFSFSGRGTLHYEYKLGGGSLVVQASGMSPAALPAAADWQVRTIAFDGFGAHDVAFVYTAAGGDATAALRNVRWEEEDGSALGMSEENGTRTDLREGVRKPKRVEEILPFTYSSTNWIGVAGATAESTVRVTIVQMTGTAPDAGEWTDEVPDTTRVLMKGPGEAAVKWKVEGKGVWKATFDILNGEESVHHEESWFDLRKTKGINGFMLFLY